MNCLLQPMIKGGCFTGGMPSFCPFEVQTSHALTAAAAASATAAPAAPQPAGGARPPPPPAPKPLSANACICHAGEGLQSAITSCVPSACATVPGAAATFNVILKLTKGNLRGE